MVSHRSGPARLLVTVPAASPAVSGIRTAGHYGWAMRRESDVLVRPDGTRLWFEMVRAPCSDPPPRALVVLCPPGGRNAACWPPAWVRRLAAGGHGVVRFDWRGQGRSDWVGPPGAGPGWSDPERLVDDVVALCERVVPDTSAMGLSIVGAGLGGWVATRVAQERGRRGLGLGALVLAGTSCWYSDPAMPGPTEPTVVALVLRRRGGGPAELIRALSREAAVERGGSGPPGGALMVAEVQRWLEHGFNPDDAHRATWLAARPLERDSASGDLTGLARRVVVVHGDEDPVVPLAHGRRLADRTGTTLRVVPAAGHHLDEAVLDALGAALGPPLDPQIEP